MAPEWEEGESEWILEIVELNMRGDTFLVFALFTRGKWPKISKFQNWLKTHPEVVNA